MLFLHLAGLVIWFGSLMGMTFVILFSNRQIESNETRLFLRKTIRTLGWIAHPTSILVLVSGIFMVIEMNFGDTAKPLWLIYMERGGGVVILLGIAIIALMGSRMVKRLGSVGNNQSALSLRGGTYLTSLLVIIFAILSVILVVSFRL
ncbi:hypothetical protein ACFSTH_14125 [Paenibacillus yanchengensis]